MPGENAILDDANKKQSLLVEDSISAGYTKRIKGDAEGNLNINQAGDFYLNVAKGLIPGHSFIEKFGENPDVDTDSDPEDLWGFGGVYNFSSTADIVTISSSNAGDTQDITIVGQTVDGVEVTQTITLNGQSKVTLSTPLWRIYRMYNVGNVDIAGTVYCYVDCPIENGIPGTDANVRAVIVNGNNQTEMAIYTVPDGKTAYFLAGFVAMSKSAGKYALMTWKTRLKDEVFRVQSRINCVGTGSSIFQYKYPVPVGPIPAGTDIKITVEEVEASNTGCAGGFTILLVDD